MKVIKFSFFLSTFLYTKCEDAKVSMYRDSSLKFLRCKANIKNVDYVSEPYIKLEHNKIVRFYKSGFVYSFLKHNEKLYLCCMNGCLCCMNTCVFLVHKNLSNDSIKKNVKNGVEIFDMYNMELIPFVISKAFIDYKSGNRVKTHSCKSVRNEGFIGYLEYCPKEDIESGYIFPNIDFNNEKLVTIDDCENVELSSDIKGQSLKILGTVPKEYVRQKPIKEKHTNDVKSTDLVK